MTDLPPVITRLVQGSASLSDAVTLHKFATLLEGLLPVVSTLTPVSSGDASLLGTCVEELTAITRGLEKLKLLVEETVDMAASVGNREQGTVVGV